jgi:hypothetical protein
LCFPDGREETRLTDHPVAVGDALDIMATQWEVVERTPPEGVRAEARFMCAHAKTPVPCLAPE